MDDPGWRRGMHTMVLTTAAGGLSFLTFTLAHRTDLAFAAPFVILAGVGAALHAYARARTWTEYGRGLRDGFWGGVLLVAGFLGVLLLMAWPWM